MLMNTSLYNLLQVYTFPCSLLLRIILPYMRLYASSPSCCLYSVSVYLYLYESNNAKGFQFDQALGVMLIATY